MTNDGQVPMWQWIRRAASVPPSNLLLLGTTAVGLLASRGLLATVGLDRTCWVGWFVRWGPPYRSIDDPTRIPAGNQNPGRRPDRVLSLAIPPRTRRISNAPVTRRNASSVLPFAPGTGRHETGSWRSRIGVNTPPSYDSGSYPCASSTVGAPSASARTDPDAVSGLCARWGLPGSTTNASSGPTTNSPSGVSTWSSPSST